MYKYLRFSLIVIIGLICSCCSEETKSNDWIWDEDPTADVDNKPRFVWIDAAANFPDYANNKENIERDLLKVKNAGFTDVVVDVRPTMGDVLFRTNVVDQVKKLDVWTAAGYVYYERTALWDYLDAFVEIGHKLGLRVNAAINTFVGGNLYSYGLGKQGLLFRDSSKKKWGTTLNLKGGLTNTMDVDIKNDPNNEYGTKFLNPINEEVQQFILDLLGDLAKYNVDGIYLDRCRYNDFASDFSDISKKQFEDFIGEKVEHFPDDIIIPGTASYPLPASKPIYFKKWLEFRVKVIHDFIAKAKAKVKSVNSKINFGVYVGGWYSTYYDVGVNWASPKYDTAANYPEWATEDYKKYGYANLLDFMLVGAYAPVSNIYGNGEWTMQGFCRNAHNLLMGDVKFAGGPDIGNATGWENGGQGSKIPQTVDACINAGDGYFIFDLVHIKKYDYWSDLKVGFDSYLKNKK